MRTALSFSHNILCGLLLSTVLWGMGCASIERRVQTQKEEPKTENATSTKTTAANPKAPPSATTHYTVISFAEGHADLSSAELQKLKHLANTAKKYGKEVNEIQILAWADIDDPALGVEKESAEYKMAAERAAEVRKYLRREIPTKADIQLHNMTSKPTAFNQLVKGDDLEMKTTFENTGSASLDNGPRSSLVGNKASKAIVLVRYEDQGTL